jgi:hypothetical protein
MGEQGNGQRGSQQSGDLPNAPYATAEAMFLTVEADLSENNHARIRAYGMCHSLRNHLEPYMFVADDLFPRVESRREV